MKVLSWNVRGLGARSKKDMVKDLICLANPDIVVLQETRLNSLDRKVIKVIWSSRRIGWLALDAVNSAGGIVMMWKEDSISVSDSLVGIFSISINCVFMNFVEGWISRIYGPCSSKGRRDFWRELYNVAGLCQGVWCVAGDFNVIR